MDFQAALSGIERGKAAPVYLLYGSRTFAIEVVDALRKAYVVPEWEALNFSPLDGKDCPAAEVVSMARAAPIGSGKRLVFVTEPAWLRGQRLDHAILAYLEDPPESSILVMYQEEKPSQQSFLRKVEEMGGLIDCSSRKGSVAELVKSRVKEAGKSIAPEAVWAICSMTADDADFARTEVEKIIACAGDEPVVNMDHVNAVGFGHSEATVFELVDAVVAGDADKSMSVARSLALRNDDPHHIMQTLAWYFRTVYRLKFLVEKDLSAEEAAKEAGIRPFLLKKFMPQVRRLGRKTIASCMEAILETGVAVNSGVLDESLAIDTLIVEVRRRLGGAVAAPRPTSGTRR